MRNKKLKSPLQGLIDILYEILFEVVTFTSPIFNQFRTQHSIAKAAQAEEAAELARDEGKIARAVAKEMSPEYHQPGLFIFTEPTERVATRAR